MWRITNVDSCIEFIRPFNSTRMELTFLLQGGWPQWPGRNRNQQAPPIRTNADARSEFYQPVNDLGSNTARFSE